MNVSGEAQALAAAAGLGVKASYTEALLHIQLLLILKRTTTRMQVAASCELG